ncbi:MAG: glycoside hydrolase family 38 C-terminal domain-containing protein [Candidatus Hodarchaeota archaeon]
MNPSKINVFITPHFHYDYLWCDTPDRMGVKTARIIKEAILIMRNHPKFKFVIDSAMAIEYFKLHYPKMMNELIEYVKQKRIELVGGMIVAPDTLLPNGESLVRQILYGKTYFKKNFGINPEIGYLLDSFGQTAQLPQILEKSGFKYLIFGRGARNRNLPAEFLWKAPNGSKVLAHFISRTYRWIPLPFNGSFFPPLFPFFPALFTLNLIPQNFRVYEMLKKLFPPIKFLVQILNNLNIGIPTKIGDMGAGLKYAIEKRLINATTNNVLILNGDDNLPPSTNILDAVNYLQKKNKKYNLNIALPSEFFQKLLRAKKKFGTVNNYEFSGFPDKFVGTFSSRMQLKQKIRRLENLFYLTEIFATISSVYNKDYIYPKELIRNAIWRILCCDFHDGIPGCHVDAVFSKIIKMLKLSETQLHRSYKKAVVSLKSLINTSKLSEDSIPLLVFNPICITRSDITHIRIPENYSFFNIFDEHGNQIAIQKDLINSNENEYVIKASEIPSIGYKVYQIKTSENKVKNENKTSALIKYSSQNKISEVKNIRFTLNFKDNKLKSISDRNNDFIISASKFYINDLRISTDRGDSYLHGRVPKKIFTTYDNEIEILENGQLRTVIRLKSKLKCKNKWFFKPINQITQYIILYNFETNRIDFITRFKNKIKNVKIQVCFPVGFKNPKIHSEIPYGFIERDIKPEIGKSWTDIKNKFAHYDRIFPVINWMDISDNDKKGLSLINCGLPEYEIGMNKDIIFLTLLRSTGHVANIFPGAVPMILGLFYGIPKALELTNHEFKYSILFHGEDWNKSSIPTQALSYNIPLFTELLKIQEGNIPDNLCFVKIEPECFLINSIKKAEENPNEIIIRIRETLNKQSTGKITFFSPIKEVNLVNLLEEPIKKIKVEHGNSFSFKSNPQDILTFAVSL